MAFVSERVRTEDAQKYATQQVHLHGQWTVDRENGIWLCKIRVSGDPREPNEDRSHSYWDFYWHGHYITLWMHTDLSKSGGGRPGGPRHEYRRLSSIDLPVAAEPYRAQILKDLEAAFLAYKNCGYLSTCTTFTQTFEIPEEFR
ncbi:hypothetical protein FACS1894116_00390 [Betaproteobacteria bacterium]|nr:hypothetical protein FACS1894116_00390 [Betaproteobacteria bacterium]GHT97883.1 hypothetical protein FACS1894154_02260 [Betaproteobacteria bacterium]GHU21489.1 hypothetical protein FACS189488_00170 [Betaproteobacteria bacterium]